jgi:hypothetical protein
VILDDMLDPEQLARVRIQPSALRTLGAPTGELLPVCPAQSRDRVIGISPHRKSLLGSSIHPLFIGQVATRHPLKILEANDRISLGSDDEAIARGEKREPDL